MRHSLHLNTQHPSIRVGNQYHAISPPQEIQIQDRWTQRWLQERVSQQQQQQQQHQQQQPLRAGPSFPVQNVQPLQPQGEIPPTTAPSARESPSWHSDPQPIRQHTRSSIMFAIGDV